MNGSFTFQHTSAPPYKTICPIKHYWTVLIKPCTTTTFHHFFYTLHYSRYFVDNQSYTKCIQPLHSSTLPYFAYTHNRTKELKWAQVISVTRDRTFNHSDTFFLFPQPVFLSGTTDLCRRQCNQKAECIYTFYIPDYQIFTFICAECRQNINIKLHYWKVEVWNLQGMA